MIICAVEDLLFQSRLRTAASHAGVDMRFVKSPEALVAVAQGQKPSLVILDLNADRLRPLDMLADLRADPLLADIHAVGFVAHTDTERIAAARAAGADEVMARSLFVTRLPDLLRQP